MAHAPPKEASSAGLRALVGDRRRKAAQDRLRQAGVPPEARLAATVSSVLVVVATFLVDLRLPLGVAAAVPYSAAVLLSLVARRSGLTLAVAVASSILTVVGMPLSPSIDTEPWIAATNRILSLGAIWATAALGLLLTLEWRRRSEVEATLEDQSAMEETLALGDTYLAQVQRLARLGSYRLSLPAAAGDHWSDELYRITGVDPAAGPLTAEEYLVQVVHPGDQDKVRGAVERGRSEGIPFEIDYRVVRPDGTVRHVHEVSDPVRGRDGQVVQLLGTVLDITERKATEEALRQGAARTRSILDGAMDGIVTIDEAGTIHSFNPAAEEIFGYTAREVIGEKVSCLMPSPDRERHDTYIDNYLETGERRVIGIGREVTGRRKDGQTFPLELAVSEVIHGDQRSFIGTVRDLTEQKRTEELLARERDFAERLVETAQVIVLVLDLDGTIVRFNRYMEEVSGYSLEELRGRKWFETLLPERETVRIQEVFSQVASGEPLGPVVNAIRTRDGRERQIEWFNTPLEEDGITGILAVGQDITQRLYLEEQVRQSQKMEAVGRLAGGVAHDFNTLLGAITGYAEMLLESLEEGETLRRPAEQIHKSAARGAKLTGQLLAFSRSQVIEPRVLDFNRLLDSMGDMLSRLIGARTQLASNLAPDLGRIKADPGQMEQVVMNLVVNACDAMPDGGRIEIRTANTLPGDGKSGKGKSGDGQVLLEVSDTGCGMDAATRGHIFEPFFTTKEPGVGTGLGLSTVYGIVTSAGGSIDVRSAPGKGTTFRILLPRVEGDEVVVEPEIREPESGRGSEKVLVVEDDEMFRELLGEVLSARGYTVLTASRPEEALSMSPGNGERLDLLVSDVLMPGLTGSELASKLQPRFPDMKVLLMSGFTDDALADRGISAAGQAFIQKPFSTSDFVRTVRELLDGRE